MINCNHNCAIELWKKNLVPSYSLTSGPIWKLLPCKAPSYHQHLHRTDVFPKQNWQMYSVWALGFDRTNWFLFFMSLSCLLHFVVINVVSVSFMLHGIIRNHKLHCFAQTTTSSISTTTIINTNAISIYKSWKWFQFFQFMKILNYFFLEHNKFLWISLLREASKFVLCLLCWTDNALSPITGWHVLKCSFRADLITYTSFIKTLC